MKFPSRDFDNAVAALCHGTVSDDALTELHELLRTDADARDEYLWRVEVHGKLAAGSLDFSRSADIDETDNDWEANATVIDGSAAGRTSEGDVEPASHVVIGANNATLDGFTVTGGSGKMDGGGMHNDGTSPVVRNCTFRGNTTAWLYPTTGRPPTSRNDRQPL